MSERSGAPAADTPSVPPRNAGLTPSQTVGPFFSIGLTPGAASRFRPIASNDLVGPSAPHERIVHIEGRVLDGDGAPVPDAVIEIWQADPQGLHQARGFGRAACDVDGRFAFRTLKPGRVAGPGGVPQAPHVAVHVFARGLLTQLVTRIYFPDEKAANATDPILALVPEERRRSLVAALLAPGVYAFDIRLQGEAETVFFEV